MTDQTLDASPTGGSAKISRRFWLIVAALVIAEFTCALGSNMVTVALSKLYGLYGDPAHVTWLITAYTLTSAATVAISSRLGDLYGRRRMLILMLLFAVAGSLVSALGHDLNVIIFGRAIQGASVAVLPLAFGILRETAQNRKELNVGVGMLGGTFSFSTGIGILAGGVIVDHAPWQGIFVVTAVTALGAIALAWSILPRDRPRAAGAPLDLIGGLGVVVPIAALLLGLNSGKAEGWDAPVTLELFAGGLVGLVVWVIYELRQADPMINLRLLRTPQIAIVNLMICTTAMAPMIYPQVLLPLLQQPLWTGVGLGMAATMAGLVKLPTNFTSGIAGIFSGYGAHRYTLRRIVIWATGANLIAWVLLVFWHDSVWSLVLASVLLIAPAGTIMFGVAPGLIIDATPEDRTSEATGLTSVLRAIASSVGSQLIALCLATSLVSNAAGARFPDERAYLTTFIFVAACSLVSFVFALMIPRPRPPAQFAAAAAAE